MTNRYGSVDGLNTKSYAPFACRRKLLGETRNIAVLLAVKRLVAIIDNIKIVMS